MDQNKNLIIAIAMSVAILVGFQYFMPAPTPPAAPTAATAAAPGGSTAPTLAQAPGGIPAAPGGAVAAGPMIKTRDQALAESPRVAIRSPRLSGSINLRGARIDDVTLPGFRESIDPTSPIIHILQPLGGPDAYYGEFGWVADPGVIVPGADTVWTADRAELTEDAPVALTWDNGQGLRFIRRISVDKNFMLTIADRVEATGGIKTTLYPYALASRLGTPPTQGYFILHEGLIGMINGTLREHKYSNIKEETNIAESSKGGWIGVTDKYWLVAVAPRQDEDVKFRFTHLPKSGDRYQIDYLGAAQSLSPETPAVETAHRFFVGAKEVKTLQAYEEGLGIQRFDYAVDWGWFYFLTKPIFQAMNWLHGVVGNFGIAILLLTVLIKLAFFPLANRSYEMMSKMKLLAPKMQEMKEKYADDKMRLNQEMMALYKKEKVNPLSGCLPIVLQIPVFFSLYKVLFVTIEMRHAPFYGWIHDLSAPDPTTIANLFGLIPWHPPAFLMLGAWPLIMGVTMWLQQRLNPQPTDPMQAKIFMFMPIIFTFMLASFPAGLVIYWAWNNLLSIAQQWVIMRRVGAA